MATLHLEGDVESWYFSYTLTSKQKFEDLKALVLMRNPRVPEDFILECFIGGLKEDIGETVKLHDPYNLTQVVSCARKQEKIINARERKNRWVHKGSIAPVGQMTNVTKNNDGQHCYHETT
ncbi:hypothetical protein RND71_026413 [Anisodus tanguticus]|uniref:Uncharacterized protein n=1 Tax=Anisodus tanguticus TaxID=243964 RepID=A0AAE1VAH2_9SOLA|nr:hypothetical protein RND71_026413 [Anisodus tanguticus]